MPDWLELAACKAPGVDPQWFFPTVAHNGGYGNARKVCAMCPVKQACLDQAMSDEFGTNKHYRAGMYGGLSPSQRYDLSRGRLKLRRSNCAVCKRLFDPGFRGKLCCSKRCHQVREAERARVWQRQNRPRKTTHGGIKMAKSGCCCVKCTGRRRTERRKQRALADARAENAA